MQWSLGLSSQTTSQFLDERTSLNATACLLEFLIVTSGEV